MQISLRSRFIAYTCLGGLLLLVYQIVFMARTSAARDWNHLHSTRFSLTSLQRLTLHSVNGSAIENVTAEISENSIEIVSPSHFKHGKPNNIPKHTVIVSEITSNAHRFRISKYSSVFGYQYKGDKLLMRSDEIKLAAYSPSRSVHDEVIDARRDGKKALIYLCPLDWIPNYGLRLYDIPVIAVHNNSIVLRNEVEFTLKELSKSSSRSLTWHLPGFTADTLVIADTRGSPESSAIFLEIARVFKLLVDRGWRPLRSLQFISYAHFSVEQWAEQNKSWLKRRAVTYIDCGQLSGSTTTLAISPALNQTARWALSQLYDAGLLHDINTTIPSARLGSNHLNFDFQVPSVSMNYTDPTNAARILGLLAITLAQDAILPFNSADYFPFVLGSREFEVASLVFDKQLDELRLDFIREYPWYQGQNKLRALVRRKRANLIVRQLEHHFRTPDGHHALFESDPSGTSTVTKSNITEIGTAITEIVSDFLKFL